MKLFIAEKPSLGRAIVDALPKPHKKQDGFIEASDGTVVTWCIGHLLEQAQPEDYDSKFKKWQVEHLPIIPTQWQLKPKPKTRKQLTVIKKLIGKATTIVNAGDADREGQILVDEVISYCGASKRKIDQAQRCLISDLNTAAVSKSLHNLQSNKQFVPLAVSALARARADWLYGLNMTRLCTLQGQKSGYQGVLSIGRVQTPILGLVVKRDLEIEQFTAKPFYEVIGHFQTQNGEFYQGKWQPSEACEPYMDEASRVLSKPLAENVVQRITDKPAVIDKVKTDKKQQVAPLPFSLSGLQIAAAKAFGLSAKQVLDTCQSLYEKHKLITYPRSDCQYLPEEHFADVPKVAQAMAQCSDTLKKLLEKANLSQKGRAWNDKKVSAHHAIIPTANARSVGNLTSNEQKLYGMIGRQYIAQFYPKFEYKEKQIDTIVEGGCFVSKQKEITQKGWKSLFESSSPKSNAKTNVDTDDQEWATSELPQVTVGQQVHCQRGELVEKMTSPPKPFNDASLLSALTGVARFVTDPAIKKLLRDTDGLGTEATRAGIIELLFKRQFLTRTGKNIIATPIGRQLIQALPDVVSQPDMTALWESQLESISQQSMGYKQFITQIEQNLAQLIEDVKTVKFESLPQSPANRGAYKPRRPRSAAKKTVKKKRSTKPA
ncbi:DNA topoisomerase III [Psychrosphaera sp. 1_MG-2023]|uniref:DNA topoisomerase III n=1 Tax=Psychrosphaera sp. 1_MG-2023 TaxID=3062643 RepID=UPI0026E41F91|nr:DNA topoisomerase III [Psychrosphaera sp. 1_MG-2023]MDO6720905.1 DNA topoisomerase III [Psychrosphaera sp. 1_MG-2023]